jgi:hypothetical protein
MNIEVLRSFGSDALSSTNILPNFDYLFPTLAQERW